MGAGMEYKRACRLAPALRIRLLHIGKKETVCGNMSHTVHDATRPNKPNEISNLLIYILDIVIPDYSKMLILQAASAIAAHLPATSGRKQRPARPGTARANVRARRPDWPPAAPSPGRCGSPPSRPRAAAGRQSIRLSAAHG